MLTFSPIFGLLLATLSVCTEAHPSSQAKPEVRAAKPPAFFLAGDSTTAKQSANGGGKTFMKHPHSLSFSFLFFPFLSIPDANNQNLTNGSHLRAAGWGDGFLNTTLVLPATGHNYGHNGATTVSFRAGGDWSTVLSAVTSSKSTHEPYVTIQFGHNDQKATADISMAQFTSNLETFVREVKNAGGTPIVVTSISRRNFNNSKPPTVKDSLADVTAAAKTAAKDSGAVLLDLNKASMAYLNAIGPNDAHTYNLNADDNTHLNAEGSVVFGGMVAELMRDAIPGLKEYLKVGEELAEDLASGTYYWPKL